jgi:hypothetical protein
MRARVTWAVAVTIVAGVANVVGADPEPARGTLEGRIVDGAHLSPIEGATVVVTDSRGGPLVVTGTTDSTGRYRYLIPPGTYEVMGVFGDARWIHHGVIIDAGKVTQVPGALTLGTEVVTIHEHLPNQNYTAAQPVASTVKPILPYSDEAMDKNVWAVGWVLLDVDDHGTVTAFRYLLRPGYGLEVFAEREIWNLRFEPARDDGGKPMASKVLWKLEWPAFHWAKDHKLFGPNGQGALVSANQEAAEKDAEANSSDDPAAPRDAMRSDRLSTGPTPSRGRHANGPGGFLLPGKTPMPPCKGLAPLNLDMHQGIYRDCTPPDLNKVNTEPVIPRPAN